MFYRLKIYINRSRVNKKIEAVVMCNQKILKAYIRRTNLYKICYNKLYRILIAIFFTNLIINIEKQYNIIIAKIYINNQVVIQKV